jgi:hypothetical protein
LYLVCFRFGNLIRRLRVFEIIWERSLARDWRIVLLPWVCHAFRSDERYESSDSRETRHGAVGTIEAERPREVPSSSLASLHLERDPLSPSPRRGVGTSYAPKNCVRMSSEPTEIGPALRCVLHYRTFLMERPER